MSGSCSPAAAAPCSGAQGHGDGVSVGACRHKHVSDCCQTPSRALRQCPLPPQQPVGPAMPSRGAIVKESAGAPDGGQEQGEEHDLEGMKNGMNGTSDPNSLGGDLPSATTNAKHTAPYVMQRRCTWKTAPRTICTFMQCVVNRLTPIIWTAMVTRVSGKEAGVMSPYPTPVICGVGQR